MTSDEFWDHVESSFGGAPVRLVPKCHNGAAVECYMVPERRRIIICCAVCERPIIITKIDDEIQMATG